LFVAFFYVKSYINMEMQDAALRSVRQTVIAVAVTVAADQ
jgi:hypothetical protein